jgi:hypothetical protein
MEVEEINEGLKIQLGDKETEAAQVSKKQAVIDQLENSL